jgi:hypothetical protein
MTPDSRATGKREINLKEHTFVAEYIRHLNTLSTGSVLLITIFLEKLFVQPRWKVLVGAALVGFLMAVIGGVAVYSVSVLNPTEDLPKGCGLSFLIGSGLVFMWFGFLVGIISMAIFALRNLY